MAFMDFMKKKEPPHSAPGFNASPLAPPPSTKLDTPTEYVQTMQSQGLSNNQIIQILQQQGYQPTQIYDAFSQASLRGTITGAPPMASPDIDKPMVPSAQFQGQFPNQMQSPQMSQFSQSQMQGPPMPGQPGQMPPMPGQQAQMPSMGFSPTAGRPGQSPTPSFEEIAESIVDEKWKEVSAGIAKDKEWRENTEIRIAKIEQSISDLKADLENLHKAIVGKIADYDKNLLNVGTEIRAMEKVFQKILPTLTDNVTELSRITKTMKPPIKK